MTKGKIVKALSGFYYVEADDQVYQCRGRGLFRKQKINPLVGDDVEIDIQDDGDGYVVQVNERKNELIRPPVANIDQAIIVTSATQPEFNALLLDRFLVLVESNGIEPVIVISKMDLIDEKTNEKMMQFKKEYEKMGYPVLLSSAKVKEQADMIIPFIEGKTSVIAGQSGVGKSSLLNALKPGLNLETNIISESLGRGKHTTRHVELISLCGGHVADTPGFSSLEFTEIEVSDLTYYFPEMLERINDCKFRGCQHHKEPKCAVKEAVEIGEISSLRYNHYLQFLDEIHNRKPRY
ncbi:ribosome biogenesis GTPase [Salirhabdus euzebyi]|uniref:Small ribosomal subunit biogenesis GTPase RsgA n=1 Tax=Salirhabdus euzebyi TaxID=394506 RepID=A0A841Q3M9_9BACI|nr:ribosome small subunit-dependent GTPase A [Salirhabdus euzebyi]MBB6452970.1 ribosome biogenesis GTPase [Salirhabdus euzebyi]